jgi:hypothetical protein
VIMRGRVGDAEVDRHGVDERRIGKRHSAGANQAGALLPSYCWFFMSAVGCPCYSAIIYEAACKLPAMDPAIAFLLAIAYPWRGTTEAEC